MNDNCFILAKLCGCSPVCYNDKKWEEKTNKNKKSLQRRVYKWKSKEKKIFVFFVILVLPYFIYALKRGSACGFLASPLLLWLGSCCWLPPITSNGARRPDQLYCTTAVQLHRPHLPVTSIKISVRQVLGMQSMHLDS